MKKPNILFILSDSMRQDALECNGNSTIKTPNLNRLAKMGINYLNAYSTDPICVQARASITTGCYPNKATGLKDNDGEIKSEFPLLANELEKAGYDTYAMGKLTYDPYSPPGEERVTGGVKTVELAESGRIVDMFDPAGQMSGIEEYHDYLRTVGWGGYSRADGMGNNDVYPVTSPIPEEYYVDTWVADRAIRHMKKHLSEKNDKPFFMWASFPKPHSAFNPPRPYDSMYDPRQMPDCIGDISLLEDRGYDYKVLKHWNNYWDKISPECKKVIRANYYGLVSIQDKQIGRLLDFLQKNNIADDTIIIYTSDHGEMLGDFDIFFKANFYNSAVKVPLMISYPKLFAGGQTSDELVGVQDIVPTLMSLVGEQLDYKVDGIDILSATREFYISQCHDDPQQLYMLANKEWKYIYQQRNGFEELYNEIEDPSELNNLAVFSDQKYIDIKNAMREQLTNWCIENDNEIIENGKLKVAKSKEFVLPERNTTYGRRFY
jgi:arylsulfatase A-like enzyme